MHVELSGDNLVGWQLKYFTITNGKWHYVVSNQV